MGGRGGSSGIGIGGNSGLDVTKDGQTTRYYFSSQNGTNYYQRGIEGMSEPTPLNMSAREFKQRVEANGALEQYPEQNATKIKRYIRQIERQPPNF